MNYQSNKNCVKQYFCSIFVFVILLFTSFQSAGEDELFHAMGTCIFYDDDLYGYQFYVQMPSAG